MITMKRFALFLQFRLGSVYAAMTAAADDWSMQPLSTRAVQSYRDRFHKVLEFIDDHLEEDLTVARLSTVAAFSKYHFHRQFSELFGISVSRYVQLIRLKRASYRLAFRDMRITDIATAAGYDMPDGFSRAFKKSIGQSPASFREQPEWSALSALSERLSELRRRHVKRGKGTYAVKILSFTEIPVALLEHRGDPRLIGRSLRNFIDWRRRNGLPPRISATFNILYDDPAETAPGDYRLGLCASTLSEVAGNAYGVTNSVIPVGRCAVVRHVGSDDGLREAITYLYSEWLPQSGEKLRDFPLYLWRVRFFPDVPEREAVSDLFLPLK
jgi:AraC family transcriptional regulator